MATSIQTIRDLKAGQSVGYRRFMAGGRPFRIDVRCEDRTPDGNLGWYEADLLREDGAHCSSLSCGPIPLARFEQIVKTAFTDGTDDILAARPDNCPAAADRTCAYCAFKGDVTCPNFGGAL